MDRKTYLFYAPCPVLDIEAMQTWLEDMSMEGYLLKDCSKTRHSFEFYKIEPLRTHYRLTPVSDKIEEWNLRPTEEFVSITDALGWEYVCSHYRLHIFRSYSENAREIYTDPAIQKQAICQLGWRLIRTALIWAAIPLMYLLVIFAFGGVNSFWQSLLLDSMGIQIILAYFALFAMVKSTVELVRLYPIYKKLKRSCAPIERKEWKKKAPIYRIVFRTYPIILIILAFVVVLGRAAYRDNVAYQDLPKPGTNLPFLSVADMAQISEIQSAERLEDVNYMRNWSHILSPVNYHWVEIVEMTSNDGSEGLVSMDIWYHEARSSWLANNLTQEYLEKARHAGVEMIQKPQTCADFAYFYCNEHGSPSAVLRYGNTVVSVSFPRTDFDIQTLQFVFWIEELDSTFAHKYM